MWSVKRGVGWQAATGRAGNAAAGELPIDSDEATRIRRHLLGVHTVRTVGGTAPHRPILLGIYLTALAAFLVLLPLVLALSGGGYALVR